MNADTLYFFDGHPQALEIYLALEARILAAYPDTRVTVRKTQISFANRHIFACVSHPTRKIGRIPGEYIIVSFGLCYRAESPRIAVAAEPYPNRWTHHVPVSSAAGIDGELMAWIGEAYAFSAVK